MAVPPTHVRVPSQRPLAPSVASVTSVANDKGDNEMILGAVHRSPGICLTIKEAPPILDILCLCSWAVIAGLFFLRVYRKITKQFRVLQYIL